MTIPRFMLLGFIVPVLLGGILYGAIAIYEPPVVGLEFDLKNLAQYPFHEDDYRGNFSTEGSNYVLGDLTYGLHIYGLKQYDTTWQAARELGLSHKDLSEDWVDHGSHRIYQVDIKADIATIYEIEFGRQEQFLGMEWGTGVWGYDQAAIKFRRTHNPHAHHPNKLNTNHQQRRCYNCYPD